MCPLVSTTFIRPRSTKATSDSYNETLLLPTSQCSLLPPSLLQAISPYTHHISPLPLQRLPLRATPVRCEATLLIDAMDRRMEPRMEPRIDPRIDPRSELREFWARMV